MAGDQAVAGPQQAADVVLLGVVRSLVAEVRPAVAAPTVRLDSRFAEDLGLDSLAVVELRSRVEDSFGVLLPDTVLAAGTVREWLDAVRAAPRAAGVGARPAPLSAGGMVPEAGAGLPLGAETLLDALAWQVVAHGDRAHVRLLNFGSGEPSQQDLSFGSLASGARAVAAGLRARGLGPGERVAIMLPTCLDYFAAFLGTVMAGGVAVPLYPPARLSELEEHLRRQAGILGNAAAAVLIAFPEVLGVARLLRAQVPPLRLVATVGDLEGAGAHGALPRVGAGDTAMLQYTSGSTGDPKGVILTHRHLLANIAAMGAAAHAGPSDVFVSWLPLYHDMGLIGAWLAGLYWGFPLVLMSPLAFLARPARWLRAISEHHGTLSGAPNFAYELCVRRVTGPELQGVDLSSWRLAFNGSEAVSPQTLRRFGARFGPFGLRPEAMAPAYGLAEAGVAVTFPPLGRRPAIDVIDRGALARARRAAPAAANGAGVLEVVSCGRPLPGYRVRVLDSSGRQLPERREGRIEFTGPSVTPGYYRNEAATRELRHGLWADTGDLGYLAGGELYLTGRAKDVIIRGGRNLHPEELEAAAGRLDGVEHAGVAVFGCPDPVRGTERLIVVAETPRQDPQARAGLRRAITALSVSLIGGPPNDVVLAAPGTVPKTASGKIRRAAARDRYQAGTLGRPGRGIRWQVASFTVSGVRPWLRRAARSGGALAYAGYAWAATAAVAIPAWLLVITLPGLRARWAAIRAAGRLLRRLLVIPLTVTGHTPTAGPFVAVANHASFADGLILIFCLPEPVCFVAAGRFAANWLTGPFLRRIGCEFVYRAGPAQAAAETRRLAGVLRSGRSLVVWPEGALGPAPGLRPFYLGAFDAAVSAAAPVVPVGIRGGREALRPGTRYPRRYAIRVAIGEPIAPAGHGWPAVIALRDQARMAVLALSAEPDLS